MERDRPQSEGEIRCIIKYISVNPSSETEYVAFTSFRELRSYNCGENAWNRNGKLDVLITVENNRLIIFISKGNKDKN